MAGFALSPGVQVVETDLTNIVPAVSTSIGAYAAAFKWGPVSSPVAISNESELVNTFGSPDDDTAVAFLCAANFLGYSNNLLVTRVAQAGRKNASVGVTGTVEIDNADDYATVADAEFAAKYPGELGNSLQVVLIDSSNYATTAADFKGLVDSAPVGDEVHVLVIDEDGSISGTADSLLEKFQYLSKDSGAKQADGSTAYYADVLNTNSKWIWWLSHPTGMSDGENLGSAYAQSLSGGADATAFSTVSEGEFQDAYELYADSEKYDLNLIIAGAVNATVAKWIVQNVAEVRDPRDSLVFVSPVDTNGPFVGSAAATATSIATWKTTTFNYSGSYAVVDSGYKYQYDRYNDKYRWVPLNADVAGLCARTDNTTDPWFSPAGFSRGQIKNVVKLAYNPNKAGRDILYKSNVNPVVSFTGEGTVLYGDKTAQSRPSAFDRINVRRLFNVLEKAISVAAKYQLFEFNDEFTRAQFRGIVEPYLRDVQGRRGVTDFRVVCDSTNNTPEVIDSNRFVADIYIKPARSINFITLNFVATRTGVSFDEVGG